MSLLAVPASTAGLKGGGVSLTFHATSQQSDEAFSVHKLQGQVVTLDIYLMEEE